MQKHLNMQRANIIIQNLLSFDGVMYENKTISEIQSVVQQNINNQVWP